MCACREGFPADMRRLGFERGCQILDSRLYGFFICRQVLDILTNSLMANAEYIGSLPRRHIRSKFSHSLAPENIVPGSQNTLVAFSNECALHFER